MEAPTTTITKVSTPSSWWLLLVDGDYEFSWVDVGSNGSAGDAQVFNPSELKQYLEEEYIVVVVSLSLVELGNYCIRRITSVCVYVCLSAMTLKWHNIVNSQYITIQLYMMVDTPPPLPEECCHWNLHSRALEQLHSWRHFMYPPNLWNAISP